MANKKVEDLLPSHEEFCLEYYNNGFNGKRAYMKANPDCSEKSAEAAASRLLRNVKVQNYLKKLRDGFKSEKVMSIEKRREWLSGVITEDVKEKVVTNIVDNDKDEVKEITSEYPAKLTEKMKSLEILNKMDGVGTDKLQLSGDVGVNLSPKEKEKALEQFIDELNG